MPAWLQITLLLIVLLLIVLIAVYSYWSRQVQKPAKGNPAEFLAQGGAAAGRRVVVCLGASIVHGRVSVDFVDLLRQRFSGQGLAFVNAGVNGDLAYNALQRLDSVVACNPDAVVILVGTNDVQCSLSDRIRKLATRGKHLPVPPSIGWYKSTFDEILTQLAQRTHAVVAVSQLPVLGEDLTSLPNTRTCEFNDVLRQVAAAHGAGYFPLHERQAEILIAEGGASGPVYTESFGPVMGAALRHFLLGQSLDEISRRNGLRLTTDRIHLNSRSAGIVVEFVAEFLRDNRLL